MRKLLLIQFTFIFLALCLACGPVTSTTLIIRATKQIKKAKSYNADKFAPFEFYSAVEYLKMAKHVQGYADFQISANWAGRALFFANKAIEDAWKQFRLSNQPQTK